MLHIISTQQAIEKMRDMRDIGMQTEQLQAIHLSIIALKKELPLRPVIRDKFLTCPKCQNIDITYDDQYNYEYCPDCGQRLDWSKDNETV